MRLLMRLVTLLGGALLCAGESPCNLRVLDASRLSAAELGRVLTTAKAPLLIRGWRSGERSTLDMLLSKFGDTNVTHASGHALVVDRHVHTCDSSGVSTGWRMGEQMAMSAFAHAVRNRSMPLGAYTFGRVPTSWEKSPELAAFSRLFGEFAIALHPSLAHYGPLGAARGELVSASLLEAAPPSPPHPPHTH